MAGRDRALHDLDQRFLIRLDPGREPQRHPDARARAWLVYADRATVLEGPAAKGTHEPRHRGEVLLRIRPGPACDRIGREGANNGVDGRVFVVRRENFDF